MRSSQFTPNDRELVPYERLHDGFVKVPVWGGPAICWLRLYRHVGASPEAVAILTEVPGNPGKSIVNGHEFFTKYLEDEFRADMSSMMLVHVWPADFSDPPTWSIIDPVKGLAAADTSRTALEALVGQEFSSLPAHDELYGAVLRLGGGNWEEHSRPVFEALPVEELPMPHNPAGCDHYDRYLRIRASISPDLPRDEVDQQAGRDFLDSLDARDRARCWRHDGDWRSIADASAIIVDRLGRSDPDHYIEAAKAMKLKKKDRRWLVSLFFDPIFIGGGSYTNGQHRACALRFSGAPRAAIAIEHEITGSVCTDFWTYTGGG